MFRWLRFCKSLMVKWCNVEEEKFIFLWLKAVEHYTSWAYERGKVGILQSIVEDRVNSKILVGIKTLLVSFKFLQNSIPVHLSISFPCISCRWSSCLSDTRQGSKLLWWAASCWWTSCLDCGWSSVWQQRSQDRWRSESYWSLT